VPNSVKEASDGMGLNGDFTQRQVLFDERTAVLVVTEPRANVYN
jgi:hypothetical protein